jgi:RNA polymerase sigma factor (sigma-70 family)
MAEATAHLLNTRLQDETIAEAVKQHGSRLSGFIRRRVDDLADAEDILQDVYLELTSLVRLDRTVEQVAAWLFRVARNKIIDRYRKKPVVSLDALGDREDDETAGSFLDQLVTPGHGASLSSFDNGLLMLAVEQALDELPPEQRDVFVQHELEDKAFSEIAAATGVPLNTLLSRKRYAVLHLRKRLQDLYDELLND